VSPEAAYYSSLTGPVDKDVIDVALVATAPTPSAAAVGGEIGATWWTQNKNEEFRGACDPNGSYSYTPLYMLKKIRKKGLLRRESPVLIENDDLWVAVHAWFITTLIYPHLDGSISRSHGIHSTMTGKKKRSMTP